MQPTAGFNEQLEDAVKGVEKGVLISTFMRSGTHLTIDFIRKNFPTFRTSKRIFQNSTHLYFVLDTISDFWGGHEQHRRDCLGFLQRSRYPIFKAHFLEPNLGHFNDYPAMQTLLVERCKTVYVTRNLFRVLPSLWAFFETAKLKNPSMSSIVESRDNFVTEYAQKWKKHVDSWSETKGTLLIRFEDTVADPDSVAAKLASHLGESLPSSSGKDLLPPKNSSTFFHRIINYVHPNPLSSEIRPSRSASKKPFVLTESEKQSCLEIAGATLERLGYPTD
ncbi:MAG: sulfotransferase domain-containing protein [Cyanothece sp. SIO1E1]|nr:sulfotransferase domain-containing protein [Cyanothece sp. SIO1E1]